MFTNLAIVWGPHIVCIVFPWTASKIPQLFPWNPQKKSIWGWPIAIFCNLQQEKTQQMQFLRDMEKQKTARSQMEEPAGRFWVGHLVEKRAMKKGLASGNLWLIYG